MYKFALSVEMSPGSRVFVLSALRLNFNGPRAFVSACTVVSTSVLSWVPQVIRIRGGI